MFALVVVVGSFQNIFRLDNEMWVCMILFALVVVIVVVVVFRF